MSFRIPSHNNSQNERNERRAHWMTATRRAIEANKPQLSTDGAIAKMDKMAAALVANESVSQSDNCYKVRTGNGKRFFPVYLIKGNFLCACSDDERYGICAHVKAAELFAAKTVVEEKRFTARLEWGNRKGLDFSKEEKFSTKETAAAWLVKEAFDKFQPEGYVTDALGETVFEISDEFFDLWETA